MRVALLIALQENAFHFQLTQEAKYYWTKKMQFEIALQENAFHFQLTQKAKYYWTKKRQFEIEVLR